eukprot:TRINITY_DN26725_c0_g1_i1.p1 TRINITY_DN26725_c0_g1~~TRINITY_DN26725_c0_g1_i1.p1  ORF type:complete len:655 (+),score=227.84 TRINITY_DN26725_c0_g1_i1:35-1966(+)
MARSWHETEWGGDSCQPPSAVRAEKEAYPGNPEGRDDKFVSDSETASSKGPEGAYSFRRCLELLCSLGPSLREHGVRALLKQLFLLTITTLVCFFWPLWSFVWGFMKAHKMRQSDHRALERMRVSMDAAENYTEWLKIARRMDGMSGFDEWAQEDSGPFNAQVLVERIERMRELVAKKDVHGCIAEVRGGLHRHVASITNPELFVYLSGTKHLITDYHQCVTDVCDTILASSLDPQEKYSCFEQALRSFGRSALLLSGGGALGLYHTGVCKALYEAGAMPGVVSGSSAGAIIASIFCTKTDAELRELANGELSDSTKTTFQAFSLDAFDSEVFSGQEAFTTAIQRFLTEGTFMSNDSLINTLQGNIGDLTFEEAYARSGRVLNIAVAYTCSNDDTQALQCNYITTPQVVVWSAVVASCSVPGLFCKTQLVSKDANGELVSFNPAHADRYFDGSVAGDIPIKRLRELFNIGFTIVSQTNPHVVPFVQRKRLMRCHIAGRPSYFRHLRDLFVWLCRYIISEIGHCILVIGRLFPSVSGFFLYRLIDQFYTGDITIWPGVAWVDYLGVILNPTQTFVRHALFRGQRKTWPHLNRIQQCLVIEQLLQESHQRARDLLVQSWSRQNTNGSVNGYPLSEESSEPPFRTL